MPMDTEENETKYILEDIQPDTVGLVPFGANGETFFLLKSQEEKMEDYTIEEVPAADSPSDTPTFWQKVKAYVNGEIAKATMTKEQKIAEAAKTLGISAKRLAAMMGEDEEMEMEGKAEKEADVSKSQPQPDYGALEAIQKAHLEAIEKAHQAQIEALQKSMEEKYESQITGLNSRVEKAEQEREAAKEEAEVRAFIEKAGLTFRALPLSANKVGAMLHKLSKGVDEATYAEVESLLKSVDAQVFTAGLFGEIGTSRTPEEEALEDKVAKAAAEGKDPGAALLSLSVEEQRKLLAEERARVGGKR